MTNTFEKLSEVSPFWAGAIAACADQGFDARGTQELLEKCAQADPILEEEYAALIKYAEGAGVPPVAPAAPVAPVAPAAPLQPDPSTLPSNYVPNPHAPITVPTGETRTEAFFDETGNIFGNIFGIIPDAAKAVGGAGAALAQGEFGEALDVANSLDSNAWDRIKKTYNATYGFTPTSKKPINHVNNALERSPSAIVGGAAGGGMVDGLSTVVKTVAQGGGTFVGANATAVATALDLVTRAASLGGENVTTEWTKAMRDALYKQTEGSLNSLISTIGNAADPSKAVDYRPEVVKKIFDDAGVDPNATIRGVQKFSQGLGDEALTAAAFMTLPGAAVSGLRAGGGAALDMLPSRLVGSRLSRLAPASAENTLNIMRKNPRYAPVDLFDRLHHPFNRGATAAGDYGRGMFRGPTGMFKPITPGTPTWDLLNRPNWNYGARPSVIPAGPNAASFPQSLAKATGMPHLLQHTPLINRIPGAKNLATRMGVDRTGAAIGPLLETELAEKVLTYAGTKVTPDRQNPGPGVFENLFGTREGRQATTPWQGITAQPPNERVELIMDNGRTLAFKKPSDVWATGINVPGADTQAVFNESFKAYQDNAWYPLKPLNEWEQPGTQSALLPVLSALGSETADTISNAMATRRPTIDPGDKHAAADFKGVLEGYLENKAADYFEQNNEVFQTWAKNKTLKAFAANQPPASNDILATQFKREQVTGGRNAWFKFHESSSQMAPEQLKALRGTYRAGVLPPQAPQTPILRVPGSPGQ